jgi:hypothetical protein
VKTLRVSSLLLLTSLALPPAFAFEHTYEHGRLLDATTEDRLKKGTTTSHAIFTVEVDGVIYTLRGEKVGANAKDYAKGMVVGDPVEARVDGEHVYLRTPKGKELRTDILKRARGGVAGAQ